MVIEFYTPGKAVKEWIIRYLKEAITKLHGQRKEISRAEVYFKERMKEIHSEKICEIKLSIFSDSVMVTGAGKNFDQAARKAIKELNATIALNFKTGAEPPDEIVSTVEI